MKAQGAGAILRGFEGAFITLMQLQTQREMREFKIVENIQNLRRMFDEFPKEPTQRPMYFDHLHIEQLELITRLCIFCEDLFHAQWLIRDNLKTAHRAHRWYGERKEAKLARDLAVKHIKEWYKFPHFLGFRLTPNESDFLKDVYRKYGQLIKSLYNRIVRFYNNHVNVYNKYKHTFTIVVGTSSIDERPTGVDIQSRIYVRDFMKAARKNAKKEKEYLIVIPSAPAVIDYYEEIANALGSLVFLLLQSNLAFLTTPNGGYLIPLLTSLELAPADQEVYFGIASKYGLVLNASYNLQLNLRLGKLIKRVKVMNQKFATDYIYYQKARMFSTKSLKTLSRV